MYKGNETSKKLNINIIYSLTFSRVNLPFFVIVRNIDNDRNYLPTMIMVPKILTLYERRNINVSIKFIDFVLLLM